MMFIEHDKQYVCRVSRGPGLPACQAMYFPVSASFGWKARIYVRFTSVAAGVVPSFKMHVYMMLFC